MSTYRYKKCAKCGASAAQDDSLKFHRFPKPGSTNILRATAWATYCWPERDWSSLKSLVNLYKTSKVLCGQHFQDSCFTDSSKKRLFKYSIPGTKEYGTQLLQSLRSTKHQVESVPHENVPGPSTHHDIPVAGPSTHHNIPVAGPSTHHDIPVAGPSTHHDIPVSVAGLSTQQHVESVAHEIVPGPSTHHDIPVAGPSTHHDIPVAGLSTQQHGSFSQGLVAGPAGTIHQSTSGTSKQQDVSLPKQCKKKQKGILKSVNKSSIKELSETERKLYTICRSKIKAINKLKKKLKGKTKINKINKICEDESVQKIFDLKLSNSFIVMLQSQITNCRRKKKGQRYNLDQKLLALTLYKKSPACYRLLRRLFSLPCQSTLNKLLNRVPMKPGINEHIFSGLQAMAETHTEEDNLCTLVFDEMAIRKHLNYNPKSDSVDGFQDHGNHGRTEQVACNAMVFMLCGVRKKWKQPIAFYLSAKSVTSDRLAVIIKEVLTECFKIGLNVVATVCDLCSVNSKALHNLGASTETPWFNHVGREIVTIADPPHLLKCLRNMFMAHDIELPAEIEPNGNIVKGTAKWDHIQQFYDSDKLNPHFVYAPALTDKHLKPNSKQKMRVKLAAQVFSHTVTAGILAKVATNELPTEALATVTLLKKVDQLFDSLNANSQDLRRGKIFSTNLTPRSPHLKYFVEMKKFFKDMKFVNARNPPSQSGWIQTITAVERLFKNLSELGIHSISTRRLNQDPLENFFGCVRFNCGSNYNPTISQFIAGFKTAIITNLRQTSQNKNCEDDDAIISNNLRTFLMSPIGLNEGRSEEQNDDDVFVEYITDESDTSEIETICSEEQACAYVCGFIVKKINTQCIKCINLLTTTPGTERAHLFTEFKEYAENKNSLNYASIHMVQAVERAASVIQRFLSESLHKLEIRKDALLLLAKSCKQQFNFLQGCPEHCEKTFQMVSNHMLCILLKRIIILKNRDLAEEAHLKALKRKLVILQNK